MADSLEVWDQEVSWKSDVKQTRISSESREGNSFNSITFNRNPLSDLDQFIGGLDWNDSSEPPEEEEADDASKDARGVGHLKDKIIIIIITKYITLSFTSNRCLRSVSSSSYHDIIVMQLKAIQRPWCGCKKCSNSQGKRQALHRLSSHDIQLVEIKNTNVCLRGEWYFCYHLLSNKVQRRQEMLGGKGIETWCSQDSNLCLPLKHQRSVNLKYTRCITAPTTTCYLHSRIFSPIASRYWHLQTAREGKTGSNKRRYENDRKYTTGHRTDRQSRTDKYRREREPKQEDGDYERAQKRRMNGVINKRWNVNSRLHTIIFYK